MKTLKSRITIIIMVMILQEWVIYYHRWIIRRDSNYRTPKRIVCKVSDIEILTICIDADDT